MHDLLLFQYQLFLLLCDKIFSHGTEAVYEDTPQYIWCYEAHGERYIIHLRSLHFFNAVHCKFKLTACHISRLRVIMGMLVAYSPLFNFTFTSITWSSYPLFVFLHLFRPVASLFHHSLKNFRCSFSSLYLIICPVSVRIFRIAG